MQEVKHGVPVSFDLPFNNCLIFLVEMKRGILNAIQYSISNLIQNFFPNINKEKEFIQN